MNYTTKVEGKEVRLWNEIDFFVLLLILFSLYL